MKWLWATLALLFALFMTWHEWRGPPLTAQETDALLADLAAHRRAGNSGDHDVLQDLRRLAANDDGGEYFMVNLIRYRERAEYPPGFEALGAAGGTGGGDEHRGGGADSRIGPQLAADLDEEGP